MNEEKKWPREVTIRATIETARGFLPEGYDEDNEGDDALLNAVGESMETVEIESWDDLDVPEGYEIADDDEREEYDSYLESKRKT
jgi:hypothetical protein